MKNSKIAEIFAKGNEQIRTAHLFIEGNVIYSYGYHFPIAFKIDSKNALFNSNGYSITTSKHKSLVKRELLHNGFDITLVNTQELKQKIEQHKNGMVYSILEVKEEVKEEIKIKECKNETNNKNKYMLIEWYKKRFPNYSKEDFNKFINALENQEDSMII